MTRSVMANLCIINNIIIGYSECPTELVLQSLCVVVDGDVGGRSLSVETGMHDDVYVTTLPV